MVKEVAVEKLQINEFSLNALKMDAATSASDGFVVKFANPDHGMLLLFQNTGSQGRTVTIKGGDGLQGGADLTSAQIDAGKTAAITIESGRFKHVSGEQKGKVHVVISHVEVKMAAISLP